MKNVFGLSFLSVWGFLFQVRDQGHTSRGGERPGEPKGQSRFPQFQATTLQHAGILRPHRARHQRHAPLLPLPRHRVQSRGLQSGKFSFLFFLLLPTKQHFCDSFAVKQKQKHVGFASFFFTIRKT